FDSAFTPHHWIYNAGFRPGPLTAGLDEANSRFKQSTGASLTLTSPAEPVATARWGFSDFGDRANKDNAFLGDYIHQAQEPFGDLPVVALSRHGQGRVIVFGDTSAFQNIALPSAWPFVTQVFMVAAGTNSSVAGWLGPAALCGILLLIAAAALRSPATLGA